MKRTLYTCRCGSLEHMFVVSADDQDLFLEIHLAPAPFFERVLHAIRHVFGYRSKWGDFDEVLLEPEQALLLGDQLVNWASGNDSAFEHNDVY